ncbi:MAG: hypothetical protein DRQ35_05140 [Gammaproteobacteria bacterium]|nr:MAG: hypothetical protein DRQ35_05140 [Gammaproteobacteria bacterium]
MKLKKISTLCLAASTFFAASSAMAWESEDGAFSTSASVAGASDYVWRGYSQTDEQIAVQGSFDVSHSSGLYAGTWASNVDFDDDASSEIDVYAGFSSEFNDTGIGYDVGILRYIYPGENYGWNEGYGSLSYSLFNVGVAYSGSVYDTSETGVYYSAGFDYDLPYDVALNAGVGYYDYDSKVYGKGNPDSATDYHIGVSRDFFGFGFDLTYYDTDSDAEDLYSDDLADSRVVFTISKSM